MGLRVYEPTSVWDALDCDLMARDLGKVCAPFSACDWSGAKSASGTSSPVKGSGCSTSRLTRDGMMFGDDDDPRNYSMLERQFSGRRCDGANRRAAGLRAREARGSGTAAGSGLHGTAFTVGPMTAKKARD
jgi:hypothetical protein